MAGGIEWIGERDRFAELRKLWDELACGPYEPFLRHAWFEAWWDAFGEGSRLRICALWNRGRLDAVLPLHAPSRHRLLEAMANVHSPLFQPLARDEGALHAVAAAAFAKASELRMWGLPSDSQALEQLVVAAKRARRLPLVEAGETSPLTDTRGDFGEFREEKRRDWREIERRRRKLIREHETEFRLIGAGGDPLEELRLGLELEASGWKGLRGTAILASGATERFYRSIAHAFHERGEFTPSSLWVDGKLAAFDLAFVHGARYYLLKTAYDEELRRLAPGLVLRLSVIERAFETSLHAHEFLGFDMAWKRLFSNGERQQRVLSAYGLRPVSLMRFSVRRAATPGVRSAYRRLRAWPDRRARERSKRQAEGAQIP